MPFFVAHALIGASVAAALNRRSETLWQVLLLSAVLGVCPDFDYLLNVLRVGRGGMAPRVYTFIISQTRQDELVEQFLLAFRETDWLGHKSGDDWPTE